MADSNAKIYLRADFITVSAKIYKMCESHFYFSLFFVFLAPVATARPVVLVILLYSCNKSIKSIKIKI